MDGRLHRLAAALLVATSATLAGANVLSSAPAFADSEAAMPLVVVELFTSQGCSSCPPADELLGELARQPGVIALALHIDYQPADGTHAIAFTSAGRTPLPVRT